MKKHLFIAATLLLLGGCGRDEADTVPQLGPQAVTVSLAVRPESMTSITRTTDEETIRDVNFYLCDDDGAIVLHRYQTSPTLRFECVPSDYRMRIVANMDRDLGENPEWEDFTITHAEDYDTLLMAWEGDVTIPASGGTLPAVEVQRAVAKVSYNISVKPADIELQSVQLLSVPRAVSVFDVAVSPSDDPDDYTDCPETALSGRSAAGTSYLLPNMQGRVPLITDQRQKNRDNAPSRASYLLIRAVRGTKILAYYVYLGENNTSDFNVRANVHYRLHISILRGRIAMVQGDAGAFCVNGVAINGGCDLTLPEQPGPNVFGVNYKPGIYTAANSQMAYTVTVGDDTGFTQAFDIEHRFANRLNVYLHSTAVGNGKGSVTVAGGLYDAETSSLTHDRVVLCHETGCTLTALPAEGYRFDGWYASSDYKTQLSSSLSYRYTPAVTDASIFPKFTANALPLEAELTPPTDLVTGLSTKCTLTLSGTDSPDPMNVKITCSDPQVVFTLPDGRRVTSGATASLLSGVHEIALTPRAMGGLTVTIQVTDCLGQRVERTCYKEVRYPKSSAFLRTMSTATVYSDSPLTLRISTTEYDGSYSVSYNSSGQACQISYGNTVIYPDEHVTLQAGSHTFTATSYNAGNTNFTFTVTDSYGQSMTARGMITWK